MNKMRSLAVFFTLIFGLSAFQSAGAAETPLNKADRKFMVKYLNETKKDMLKAVKGLSEEQLTFKASPESWSIAECIEHIAIAEIGLWQMTDGVIQSAAEPSKKAEVKMTDEKIIAGMTNRSRKVQTVEQAKPTGKFGNTEGALKAFIEQRDKTLSFFKSTQADLRNRFGNHPVFGTLDAYQFALAMAAHGKRHTLQIEEVKANANYPK